MISYQSNRHVYCNDFAFKSYFTSIALKHYLSILTSLTSSTGKFFHLCLSFDTLPFYRKFDLIQSLPKKDAHYQRENGMCSHQVWFVMFSSNFLLHVAA